MSEYDHQAIERKWQAHWATQASFATPDDRLRPKYYVLDMFPYPSGTGLHVGHPKGYVATDIVARAKRMMGFNVLHVMGWDSFGLPTERQAVREHTSPQEVTRRNTATFKRQLQRLGLSYDWDREIATSSPTYYKWTQWIFLKLYERGLAYQADVAVNWCPALGTVLANEEVKDGLYIETQDPVERRLMKQWVLKITDYAESLLAGLDALDWPENIKEMQRHWIGRSEGAQIHFKLTATRDRPADEQITVFTTRPDTLFGGTFLVLAPEQSLIAEITTPEQQDAVLAYQTATAKRSERARLVEAAEDEKSGVFTGRTAINPVTGQAIPIWIADYVLPGYGTGAIFGCPAHDHRDYAFAKKFGLLIREVVTGGDPAQAAHTGEGQLVNSDFLNGLTIPEAKQRMTRWLEEHQAGNAKVTYRLRDWLFSRQRYWGEPIPVIHTADGNIEATPYEDLPITLPDMQDYRPVTDGQPPLSKNKAWIETQTAKGQVGRREASTMPQWAGSCWYYLRFINPHLEQAAWDVADEQYWMPVDLYVGGAEHATLHLLYARFWHHVLHDLGLVSTREPFERLFNQGMVLGTSYKDAQGQYYPEHELTQRGQDDWVVKDDDVPVFTRKEKMSKSKMNVVNPDQMCEQYGADALRLYELFMGALEDGGDWSTQGVAGCRRFLDRAYRLVHRTDKLAETPIEDPEAERALHVAIKKVTESIDSLKFNTAIAEMMVFVNVATKAERLMRRWLLDFICILAPFAPHLAEELWQSLGQSGTLAKAAFPAFDESKIATKTITIAVQVNGKRRGEITVPATAEQAEIIALAKNDANTRKFIDGKTSRREIYIAGRLVNLVVS